MKKTKKNKTYALKLYVTGLTPRCQQALVNIKDICDEHLPGQYSLEVVDLYQRPQCAAADQIIAIPTLIKREPQPARRFIGDLSDRKSVLSGLGIS